MSMLKKVLMTVILIGLTSPLVGKEPYVHVSQNGKEYYFGPYYDSITGDKEGLTLLSFDSSMFYWMFWIRGQGNFKALDLTISGKSLFVIGSYDGPMHIGVSHHDSKENPMRFLPAPDGASIFMMKVDLSRRAIEMIGDIVGESSDLFGLNIQASYNVQLFYHQTDWMDSEVLGLPLYLSQDVQQVFMTTALNTLVTATLIKVDSPGDPTGVYPGDTTIPVPAPIPTSGINPFQINH